MKENLKNHSDVILIADMDISNLSGDVVRTLAFASELRNNGFYVTLLSPQPSKEIILNLKGIKLIHVPIKNEGGSILNIIKRTYYLIKKAKELKNDFTTLMIETSPLGGYFALGGFSGYVLDIHGIHFSEIDYATPPWYVPKRAYKNYIKFLEAYGLKKAGKIVTVSETMKNYVSSQFGVNEEKTFIIPNGFFSFQVDNILKKGINEKKGKVTFVGNIAKWANVDKIIRVAKTLKNENASFYIVGDGIYRDSLELMVNNSGLKNVVFTGKVPLSKAYEMIASSEIVLMPLPQDLCTEVACPIKLLEYMALGKAMVIDEVDDVSKFLKENDAALTSESSDDKTFAENIKILLNNKELREFMGKNAQKLSSEFSWEKQTHKLITILGDLND